VIQIAVGLPVVLEAVIVWTQADPQLPRVPERA
jgi:hypothetical protein